MGQKKVMRTVPLKALAAALRDCLLDRRHLMFMGSLFAASLLHDQAEASTSTSLSPSAADIYQSYSYQRPQDILTYIRDHAEEGDSEGVLAAIDDFSLAFPMYKIGDEKGKILDELVKMAVPQGGLVIEVGSFVGYSAVRVARLLPSGARLVCIEANPDCCETIDAVLKYAGLRDRVVIESGLSNKIIPGLSAKYGQCNLLFEDHCKPCYLPDLITAEETKLIGPGSWMIADNVIYPGAPELLTHLKTSTDSGGEDDEREVEDPESRSYDGFIVKAKYEYEQKWRMGEEVGDKIDGMSIALRLSGLNETQRSEASSKLSGLQTTLKGKLQKEINSL